MDVSYNSAEEVGSSTFVVKQPDNISKILAHQQSILGMCERCIDVKPMRIFKMMKVFNIKNKTELLYTQIAVYIYM